MRGRLTSFIQKLPDKPGIYFFKNGRGEIVYIGKARSLRERIKSYMQPTSDPKVGHILAETEDVDFILTGSEKEAALLENNFVRKHQPKYNLRLKDDKSFPYLRLTLQERFPGIYLIRRVEADRAGYFGPFSLAHHARKTIHLLNRYFGIRSCAERIPGKRKRPCLEYDMSLCAAPCVELVSEEEYRERAENARLFLEGKVEKLVKILEAKMRESSEREDFEGAARWRDIIHAVEQVKEKPKLISVRAEDVDIVGFARDEETVAFFVFMMRKGKVIESEEISFPEKGKNSDAEILGEFLRSMYGRRQEIPDKILLPFQPAGKLGVSGFLRKKGGEKVSLLIQGRGRNRQLVELACRNAEHVLKKRRESLEPLVDLQHVLGLPSFPQHIEGFDISNTGGDESVGSLVVFEGGRPKKSAYRKYKVKTVRGPDDVASLSEVIGRRYKKAIAENEKLPDLILVDGGKGQLNAARNALKKLGLEDIPVASVAKKEEVIFTAERKGGIRQDRTSPALKLIQSIRDEAHRFAVSFHRRRREKKSFASLLDKVPGLGKKRKSAILLKYRDLEEIKKASLGELSDVLGPKTASSLKKILNERVHGKISGQKAFS